MGRRLRWGAALWLVRPVYVAVEIAVVAATTGGYSLVDDTVSDLGATCGSGYCSPRHALMNATFVGVGLLMIAGALLLAPRLGRVLTVLLSFAGLSSVATGLAPVDESTVLHTIAATPLFVCQPLALLLLARALRPTHPGLATALLVTGSVAIAAAVGFVVGDAGAGLLERLALWPVLGALAAVGVVLSRTPSPKLPRSSAGDAQGPWA